MWNFVSRHGMSLVPSVFSSEDSDVHLKDFSGTIEVVLQSAPIKLLKLLDAGIFPTTCKLR
jgi:hypothetical protein